jgi:hypothetical protein
MKKITPALFLTLAVSFTLSGTGCVSDDDSIDDESEIAASNDLDHADDLVNGPTVSTSTTVIPHAPDLGDLGELLGHAAELTGANHRYPFTHLRFDVQPVPSSIVE